MKNILTLIGALILSMLLFTACTQPQPPENSDPIALGDAVVVYGTDNHSLGASQIYAATVKTQHGVATSPKSAGNADGGENEILIGDTGRSLSNAALELVDRAKRDGTLTYVIISDTTGVAVAASNYSAYRYAVTVLAGYGTSIPRDIDRTEYVLESDFANEALKAKSYTVAELDAMAVANDVKINGESIKNFKHDKYEYTFTIGRTDAIPKISATVPGGVTLDVKDATDEDPTAVLTLKSPDGKTEQKYNFKFERSQFNLMNNVTIEKVYGGAETMVVIIHDDGTKATGTFLKEQFVKNGLKGTLGLVGKNFITNLNGSAIGTTQVDFDKVKVVESEVKFWQDLLDTGCFDIASHTMTHTFWGLTDEKESGLYKNSSGTLTSYSLEAGQITYEVAGSKTLFERLFPGQTVKTLIKAGFGRHENGTQISDKAYEIIMENYIAMRNSSGGMETLPIDNVYYMKCYQAAKTDTASTYINLVNEAIEKGGMQVFLFHKIEATPSSSLTAPSAEVAEFCEWLSGEVKSGRVWNAFYEDAVMYAEEYRDAKVSAKDYGNYIAVDVTDGVDNELYCHPLTVRVPVSTDKATLNTRDASGKVERVEVMSDENGQFVYVNIVPDSGTFYILFE